ncbi:unnamed protein product, partial [Trichogramma brassicae]
MGTLRKQGKYCRRNTRVLAYPYSRFSVKSNGKTNTCMQKNRAPENRLYDYTFNLTVITGHKDLMLNILK